MNNYNPEILKNDVILPLYTKALRQHLSKKLITEREQAIGRMKTDGWGVTRFENPNPEFYGDYTHHFYNYFWQFLDENLNVKEGKEMSGKFYMRVGDIANGQFNLLPLNYKEDTTWHKYFEGFKFNVQDYGKDFYRMGV